MKQHIEDLYAIIDEQESSIKIYQKYMLIILIIIGFSLGLVLGTCI